MKLMLLALILLAGCASQDRQRSDYVAANPDLDPEIRQTILNGQIRRGMTKDQVLASWGPPCWWCHGTSENSWGDTWEYNAFGSSGYGRGTLVFFDSAGKVREWSR